MGKFGDLLMQQAGGAVGNAAQGLAGGLTGMLFAGYNDRRQMKQQTKLQNLQISGEKQMTDYNYQKQLDMWNATGYGAQMKQLEGAGLNPALIYGTGGSGGMTTDIKPGQVNGADAPKGGGEVMGMAIANMQMQLMNAQRKNIEADTANKQAQTSAVPSQIQKTQTETASLTQGINNQKAQEELTKVQTSLASIEETIKGATQNDAIGITRAEMGKQQAILNSLEAQKEIDVATYNDKIQIIHTQMIGALLDNQAIRKSLQKTDQEIAQMKTAMVAITTQANAATTQAEASKEQAAAATKNAETNKKLADFERSFGKQASGILNTVLGAAGATMKTK